MSLIFNFKSFKVSFKYLFVPQQYFPTLFACPFTLCLWCLPLSPLKLNHIFTYSNVFQHHFEITWTDKSASPLPLRGIGPSYLFFFSLVFWPSVKQSSKSLSFLSLATKTIAGQIQQDLISLDLIPANKSCPVHFIPRCFVLISVVLEVWSGWDCSSPLLFFRCRQN